MSVFPTSCPGHSVASLVECATHNHRSQFGEDILLLPTLLLLRESSHRRRHHNGSPANGGVGGFFLEIGAYNGVDISNTFLLENCCQWNGTLVEANPANFAELSKSGRRAVKVHAGICDTAGTLNMTNVNVFSQALKHPSKSQHVVQVPCDTLTNVLGQAQHPRDIDFFSLDVEGSELDVLQTVDSRRIGVINVEIFKRPPAVMQELEARLTSAGLVRSNTTSCDKAAQHHWACVSQLWTRSDVRIVFGSGARDHEKYQMSQQAHRFAKNFAPEVLRMALEDAVRLLHEPL